MALHSISDTRLDTALRAVWSRLRHGPSLALGGLTALAPLAALANPSGGHVAAGSATISNPNANTTVVDQGSQHAVINWQQFSVGAGQYVQFIQPDSSAVILNRVIGDNPSSIFGDITANGQVFLINPNGILFGKGAMLDVSGLVAGTQDISDADFMAGRYQFTKAAGAPDATVVNDGSITTSAGGYVVLAGDYVQNGSVINAVSGHVLLAAGGATTLTLDQGGGLISYKIDAPTLARLAGVDNAGSIVADGGAVVMTADVANALTATAVNNSGLITAHSVSQQGGEIVLLSEGGGIENSGTLDASARQAGVVGGTVVLRGDGHTQLTPTSVIEAQGDGATGGFIELSGHTLSVNGVVDPGKGGSLLIDPSKINILAGGIDNDGSNGTDSVGTGFIAGQLNAGHNVTLVASQSIHRAAGSHISAATGAGDFRLYIGTVPVGGSCGFGGICAGAGVPAISIRTFGNINLSGLTINIKGAFIASASRGNVTTGNVTAKAVLINGSTITTGNLVTSGTKNGYAVSLTASDSRSVNSIHAGNITATGGKVLIAQGASTFGKIVVGNIIATGQFVNIHGAIGTLSAGSITAKEVVVTHAGGGATAQVKLGKITATGAFATTGSLNGDGVYIGVGSASLTMTAGAKITAPAGGVVIDGGNLHLGSVSTSKQVALDAVHTGAGQAIISMASSDKITGSHVQITASNAAHGGNIKLGKVTATGGGVVISAQGGTIGSPNSISAGSIKAIGGGVSMGATRITTGNITATADVVLNGLGSNGNAQITVNGNVKGSSGVFMDARGNNGGNIHVTGSISAANGGVMLRGSNFRGSSGGNVSAGNITAAHYVRIFTKGGGEVGGAIKVGTITAGGSVIINADYTGNSNNETVQTGAISAGDISIAVKGKGAKFTAPSLKATGASSSPLLVCSCEGGQGGVHSGYIFAKMTGNAGSASFDVTGAVKSVHGTVYLNGGKGGVTAGSVTAGWNVFLSGNTINVGAVTAGTDVSIIGNTASAAAHITATGLVKGRRVFVDVNGNSSSSTVAGHGGAISLTGGASATGIPSAELSIGKTGINIQAYTKSLVKMDIATGALKAAGGNIVIRQGGASGSVQVTADITASSGSVHINENGRGSINVTGNISAKNDAFLSALNPSGSGANIKVTGGITAGSITIAASASTGANIKVTGSLTAKTGHVWVNANSSTGGRHTGGNVSIGGPVKSSHGSVSISGRGGGNIGGNVKVTGTITAATRIFASGSYTGTAEAGVGGAIDVTGKVSGSHVSFHAKDGGISVGKIISQNGVTLSASGSRAGGITVNGTITTTAGDVRLSDSGTGGGVHVAGLITATAGAVHINADGSGGISVAGIKAGHTASLHAVGSHAGAIKVNGNISGSGEGVFITATGHSGANVDVTGTIKVGNTESGANLSINASAGTHSGGNVSVGGKITTATGRVSINTKGDGEVGGQIHIGAVSAALGVSISANYLGNSPGFKAVTGKIDAEFISVKMTGKAPQFSAAGLVATGNSTSHEDIAVNLDATGAGHSSGAIKITAPVKSSNGSVTLDAGAGSVSGGRGSIQATTISGKTGVSLDGDTINVGALTATSGNVSISGASAHRTTDITVTGAIIAKNVFITENFLPTASHSGAIHLQGPVTATGASSGGPSGCAICIRAEAHPASALALSPVKMQISTASLTAAHGNIRVTQYGRSGGIHASGTMSAATGGVFVFAGRGKGGVSVGSLTAAGFVEVSASGDGGQAGNIKVNGNINASSMFISADGKGGGNVTVTGSLHAVHNILVQASGSVHSGGDLKVTGPIKSTQGKVALTTRGGSDTGGRISVGKISAHSSVNISASYNGNVSGFLAKTGKLTGQFVNVAMTGFDPHFSATGIVANGAGPTNANISVALKATGAGHSSGAITLTGAVKSSNGSVTLDAGVGSVSGGRGSIQATTISGKTGIGLVGDTINVGALTATSGAVSISGASAVGHATRITVTGAITGKQVKIEEQFLSTAAHGGSISLQGQVTATANGATIETLSNTQKTKINLAGVTASHGNLFISQDGGSGDIKATGLISAGAGSVNIHAGDGANNITLVGVTAKTTVNISASGGGSLGGPAGNITVTGNLKGAGVKIATVGNGGGNITVNGNITANGTTGIDSIDLAGSAGTHGGGDVKVTGSITDPHGQVIVKATGTGASGGNITLGNVVAGASAVSASAGGNITVTTGGSLDLVGATLTAVKSIHLHAKNLMFSKLNLTDSAFSASAASNLTATSAGTLSVTGMTLKAGKVMTLHAGGSLHLGSAVLSASVLNATATTITNSGSAGKITAGGGTLKSTGNIVLSSETLHVHGAGPTLSAGGSIDMDNTTVNGTGVLNVIAHTDVNATSLTVNAGDLGITAGHNVNLAQVTIKATGKIDLHAGANLLLGGAQLSGGTVDAQALSITNSSSAGSIAAAGGTLKATTSISLAGERLNVIGTGPTLDAGGSIDISKAVVKGAGALNVKAGKTLHASSLSFDAGGLQATGGSSVDLSQATLRATGTISLKAGQDIVLSGVDIHTGVFLASAGGTVHNGGGPGTITAQAIAVTAKKDITLSSTDITLGSGAIPGLAGDTLLLQELGALGITPTSSTLNGAFLAQGKLTLGGLTVSGHYLMLQGAAVSILGPVSVPTSGFLVQVEPVDPTVSIGVEDRPAATQPFNISNQGFFALFPGDTIAIGDDTESGAVFIGINGRMTLAPNTNLFFDTTGPITGLGLITTTGIIGSLESVAGSGNNEVVTVDEIDPSAGGTKTGLGDQTDKRHLGQYGGTGGGGDGGTIGEGTAGGNVCR